MGGHPTLWGDHSIFFRGRGFAANYLPVKLGSFFTLVARALDRRRKQLLSHQKCVRVNFFDVRACAEQSPLKAHPWARAIGPRSMEARPERASLPASGGAEAMVARGAEAASVPPRPASTAGGTASWQQRCAGKRAGLRVRTASLPLPPKAACVLTRAVHDAESRASISTTVVRLDSMRAELDRMRQQLGALRYVRTPEPGGRGGSVRAHTRTDARLRAHEHQCAD